MLLSHLAQTPGLPTEVAAHRVDLTNLEAGQLPSQGWPISPSENWASPRVDSPCQGQTLPF